MRHRGRCPLFAMRCETLFLIDGLSRSWAIDVRGVFGLAGRFASVGISFGHAETGFRIELIARDVVGNAVAGLAAPLLEAFGELFADLRVFGVAGEIVELVRVFGA